MNIKNIKKFKGQILMVSCFLMAPSQYTSASAVFPDSGTYAGVDMGLISEMTKSTYSFSELHGKNAYPKNPLLYGVFLGHKFTDRFGFEVAYETQQRKNRTVLLGPGDTIPASNSIKLEQPTDWASYQTSVKTQHIQAVLQIILHQFEQKDNINIWAQIGASYSQLRARQTPTTGMVNGGILTAQEIAACTKTFKQWKLIPVAKLGIHYNWNSRFGLRATAGWRHLGMLKPVAQEPSSTHMQIKLKDGFNFGVGFYFKL